MAQKKNKMTWTKEQQKVIELRNRNILVSAAAGSGKTAVLVERIITMISDTEHPVDIDKLLVVTFTKAAAAEMRERIHKAIEKKIEQEPDNLHLRKQGILVKNAQITTLHSFCQNIIRNHFNEIDVDPGFRIGDEAELKLLQSDVLDMVFEKHYERDEETGEFVDQAFLELVECYSSGKSDEGLRELLLQLYTFAMSYPWPEQWLLKQKENFSLTGLSQMEQAEWMGMLKEYVGRMAEEALAKNAQAIQIANSPNGPYIYQDAFVSDREFLEKIENADTYIELFSAFCDVNWKRLSTKKDDEIDPEKRAEAKKLRDEAKDIIKKLQPQFFFQNPDLMLEDLKRLRVPMSALIDLTLEFKQEYEAAKEEKKVLDFNDLEHFALKILVEEKDGEQRPTEVARMYSEEFEEIMVDEYQDSNAVQETLLNSISKESIGQGHNRFMVGDVKQSIYKFRLARPEIFMEKYESYSLEESDCQRIDLSKNFRSRSIVLDSVNEIFRRIMKKDLGKVEYDSSAELHVGNTGFPEGAQVSDRTELLLFDPQGEMVEEEEDSSAEEKRFSTRELEARMVAKRIKELVDKEQGLKVVDKNTGELRPCQYGDIVILLRTMSGWSDVFLEELKSQGIPAYTETRTGYFSTFEIRTILQFLKVLDNPRQDIPLAAVLRSPIGNFSAQDLAKMRQAFPEGELYDIVEAYSKGVKDDESANVDVELSHRAECFLEKLSYFRSLVPFTPIHKLLEEIYEKTGYYDFVSVMPAGGQRRDNLDMLLKKAIDMEATSLSTLFHFNRYIEKLHKYEVDFGEAVGADTAENAVQIMSIHKSKGLEFPVVFVSGMAKPFNKQDSRSKIVLQLDLGIGPDVVDYKNRTKMPSLLKKTIQKVNDLENMGEELRVLYVALTRAKEKLIMTGYLDKKEEMTAKWQEDYLAGMNYVTRSGAKNYLDWVATIALEDEKHFKVSYFSWEDVLSAEVETQIEAYFKKEELEQWNTEKVYERALQDKLKERLLFSYPYEKEMSVKSKLTVSEIKRMTYIEEMEMGELEFQKEITEQEQQEGEEIPYEEQIPLPEFLKKEEEVFSGADRGTVYHKVLELLPIEEVHTKEDVQQFLDRVVERGILTKQEVKLVSAGRIVQFAKSPLAARMAEADRKNKLWREQPFVIGVPAKEVKAAWDSEEMILVQGMVDAYFEEEDEIVLLDYKTDLVRTEEELVKRYHAQLEYYQKALEQITEKKVKEKIIYSLTLGKEIKQKKT